MPTPQGRIAGVVVAGVGVGVLGWVLEPSIARSLSGVALVKVALDPAEPAAKASWKAIVTAQGKPGQTLAAQACIVESAGVVGAHLWASATAAAQMDAHYWSVYGATAGTALDKSTAAEAAVAQESAAPADRLATATADSSGTAQLTLYSEPLMPGAYTLMAFAAQAPKGLIVPDAVGTTRAALQRAKAPFVALDLSLMLP